MKKKRGERLVVPEMSICSEKQMESQDQLQTAYKQPIVKSAGRCLCTLWAYHPNTPLPPPPVPSNSQRFECSPPTGFWNQFHRGEAFWEANRSSDIQEIPMESQLRSTIYIFFFFLLLLLKRHLNLSSKRMNWRQYYLIEATWLHQLSIWESINRSFFHLTGEAEH